MPIKSHSPESREQTANEFIAAARKPRVDEPACSEAGYQRIERLAALLSRACHEAFPTCA